MTTQDSALYDEWEKVVEHMERRRKLYEFAKRTLPAGHPLTDHCSQRLAESVDAYDRVLDQFVVS